MTDRVTDGAVQRPFRIATIPGDGVGPEVVGAARRVVAAAAGRRVAPKGSQVRIRRGAGTVTADVSVRVGGPGGIFALLPDVTVASSAAAAEEPA